MLSKQFPKLYMRDRMIIVHNTLFHSGEKMIFKYLQHTIKAKLMFKTTIVVFSDQQTKH